MNNTDKTNNSEEALRESEERFRSVFEDGELAIAVVSLDFRFVDVNPAMCKMVGYTKEELKTLTFPEITHPEDRDANLQLSEQLRKGEILHFTIEKRYIRKNGETLWILLTVSAIRDKAGKPVYGLAISKDITERKRTEENLNAYAEELEKKNVILEQARKKAEDATKLKDKFVTLVSHDLKSPLTSIMGFSQALHSDTEHPLHDEQKEMLQITFNNVEKMIRMIDGLLQISRLQSGQVVANPRFIDGKLVCNTVIDQLMQLAKDKEIELLNEVPAGTRLFADYDLFFGVIQNIVSNAIKFCRKGGHIRLFVPPGRKTTIAVQDTGVGINEKLLPNLFKHEVKTSTKGTAGEDGTGFGLPFAYEIMQEHGGDLSICA